MATVPNKPLTLNTVTTATQFVPRSGELKDEAQSKQDYRAAIAKTDYENSSGKKGVDR